jgi:xanthine dehydrogenase accessory factor
MDSVDTEVLKSAQQWLAAAKPVTLVTVVKTWGSAPRPVGALLAIRGDGLVSGSVSGGCVEDDLIERVKAEGAVKRAQVITYGVTKEQAERFGLPCGGTLQLVLEPLTRDSGISELVDRVSRHELVSRRLELESGRVTLTPAHAPDMLEFDGAVLTTVHGPRWRLVIIGAGQTSRYLAMMAQALDYQVTVCDPREEYAENWDVAGAVLDRRMPDDVVLALKMDAHSAVVAVTHDPKLDDMALLEALKSPAFYVGALGSRLNNAKRRERLAQFDLSPEDIARLHGPVGLQIGSKTPPEIAVSILAEMTAVRRGAPLEKVGAPREAAAPVSTDPLACRP